MFIYLLLKTNYCDMTFEGQTIHRGQLVTSLPTLARETGQTIKEVRVALGHLISTGEVADWSNNRYRVITVVKYDEYQKDGRQNGSQRADEGQAKGSPTGSQRAASIEYIDNIEEIERIEPPTGERSAKRFTPPTKEQIFDFCLDNEINLDVDRFYDYYASKGWKVGSSPMKDWKAAVRNWVRRDKERPAVSGYQQPAVKKVAAQQYQQRDYSDEDREAMERMLRMGGF